MPYKSVLNAEMQIIVKNGGTFTIAKTRPLQDRRSCCARVHTHSMDDGDSGDEKIHCNQSASEESL